MKVIRHFKCYSSNPKHSNAFFYIIKCFFYIYMPFETL